MKPDGVTMVYNGALSKKLASGTTEFKPEEVAKMNLRRLRPDGVILSAASAKDATKAEYTSMYFMPSDGNFHVFLSHNWAQGEEAMSTVQLRLLEMMPEVKVRTSFHALPPSPTFFRLLSLSLPLPPPTVSHASSHLLF